MGRPHVGLSLQPQADYRAAAEPLLRDGLVEALEWTVDNGWAERIPDWVKPWLADFGARDRLYAHGFSYSLLSGRWTERHEVWLRLIGMETKLRRYRHLSEHFCFVTAGDFAASAPMPVPMTEATLQLGRARIERLAEACGLPVGLENLAIALSPRDVAEQGAFIDRLLEPVDGFLLLDLHNLWCQIVNFGRDARALLDSYPLHRVTELHLSGGSWDQVEGAPFRRDTHDEAVPEEVLGLLELALPLCPRLEVVLFERLGGTLRGEADLARFREDYLKIREIVHAR